MPTDRGSATKKPAYPSPATIYDHVPVSGGPAPVRPCIEELLSDVLNGTIHPSEVFDHAIPFEQVPDGLPRRERSRIDQNQGGNLTRPGDVMLSGCDCSHLGCYPRDAWQRCFLQRSGVGDGDRVGGDERGLRIQQLERFDRDL
jgi:hypothetical protein